MFAQAWVATAPTSGSAAGTPAPTARNFDCTATPHSRASRSQATSEYVEGLAIFQLAEVELKELALVGRHEHARYFRPLEGRLDGICRRGPHDHGHAALVRVAQPFLVGDVVEQEGLAGRQIEFPLDCDLRDLDA